MKINAKTLPFALAFAAHRSEISLLRLSLISANTTPESLPFRSKGWCLPQPESVGWMSRTLEPSIYAVDDVPSLTDLYARILEKTGYVIRTFNDRLEALAALKADWRRPALLITDYLGVSMAADEFMHACRLVHPSLRILMASGFNQEDMRFFQTRPDSFIQKPFTPEELRQQIRSALGDQVF